MFGSKIVGDSLGYVQNAIFIFQNRIKLVAVRTPVFGRLVFSHDEKRGGKAVRQCSIRTYDRHRHQSVVCRMSGRRIDNVVVSHAILLEIPLIAAGSDNRPISSRQNAEVIILRFRTLHGNTPLAAVCFGSDNLNISSEIDKTARHTAFPVNVGNSAGRIALGNSAEIDFHTFLGKTDGCVVFVVNDIVGIGEWKETFNRLIRRNRIIAGRKSP